jgi:hypothetical protein
MSENLLCGIDWQIKAPEALSMRRVSKLLVKLSASKCT